MSASGIARLHVVVEGHVQGVGYRMFTIEAARDLDLVGWVRNRSDGSVEIMAEGLRVDLEALLRALREGPHLATVSDMTATWTEATGEFRQFWYLETY